MTESYVQIKNQESCETNQNRYNTMCDDDRKEILREENGEQYTGAVDLRFTRIEMPSPPSRSNHIARPVIDNISGGAREVISNNLSVICRLALCLNINDFPIGKSRSCKNFRSEERV